MTPRLHGCGGLTAPVVRVTRVPPEDLLQAPHISASARKCAGSVTSLSSLLFLCPAPLLCKGAGQNTADHRATLERKLRHTQTIPAPGITGGRCPSIRATPTQTVVRAHSSASKDGEPELVTLGTISSTPHSCLRSPGHSPLELISNLRSGCPNFKFMRDKPTVFLSWNLFSLQRCASSAGSRRSHPALRHDCSRTSFTTGRGRVGTTPSCAPKRVGGTGTGRRRRSPSFRA